jgi:hypothetical protein
MNRKILLLITLMILFAFIAAEAKAPQRNKAKKAYKNTVVAVKDLRVTITAPEKPEISNDWQKQMPWIISLIVGGLAFGANALVSYNSRRTSLETSKSQLDNATKLAIAQIDQSRQNNERDFNKTVLSGNRQIWITDFRTLMSELITSLSSNVIKGSITYEEYIALKLLVIKAELMLIDDSDKMLVETLNQTLDCCFKVTQSNMEIEELSQYIEKIRAGALIKVKDTWYKIKNGL